jgi:DNA-directed RNA polymerase specialized sigma24 family protein
VNDAWFEECYRRLQPALLGYARSQLDEQSAYDVVSATFETLLRKRIAVHESGEMNGAGIDGSAAGSLVEELSARCSPEDRPGDEGDASEDEWLRVRSLAFMILKGHVSNEYRARRRRFSLWQRLRAHGASTEELIDPISELDDSHTARSWLSQLKESDRHVLSLFNAGYSIAEMATILDCSPVAAARRRDRAKGRLREVLMRRGMLESGAEWIHMAREGEGT